MKLDKLVKELKDILEVHPELKEAEVWSHSRGVLGFIHMDPFVSIDTKHKPPRVKLG